MMPKGVEHENGITGKDYRKVVKIPMMPKGVEHCKTKIAEEKKMT